MFKYKSIKKLCFYFIFYFFIFFFILFVLYNNGIPTSNNSINAIKDVKKLFNKLRSNLSREEANRIREKLYKKEAVYNFLKEKEQEGSLTNKKKTVLKNVERYLKNIGTHLKNFKEY